MEKKTVEQKKKAAAKKELPRISKPEILREAARFTEELESKYDMTMACDRCAVIEALNAVAGFDSVVKS